jgi:hypothetical protein
MTPLDPKDRAPDGALALPAVTENGGRVELRLAAAQTEETRCVYGARWFVGPRMVTGSVTIAAPVAGTKIPHVSIEADDLPDWLSTFTVQLVKSTSRSVLSDQPDFSKAAWPRRLTRWRRADGE